MVLIFAICSCRIERVPDFPNDLQRRVVENVGDFFTKKFFILYRDIYKLFLYTPTLSTFPQLIKYKETTHDYAIPDVDL